MIMAGIWENQLLGQYNKLPSKTKLTLGEGNTKFYLTFPADAPQSMLGIKDENTNPNGSFKDRSLAYQLSIYLDQGKDRFVISSSGNAAISAAAYANLGGAELDVFVADTVNLLKLQKLKKIADGNKKIKIHQSGKPKSEAIQFALETGAINLRASIDDLALPGYKTIAYELAMHDYPEVDALFIPCSSGTSSLGILQGFKEVNYGHVKIYLCQTTKVNVLAREFDADFSQTDTSIADAIVDRVAHRKDQLISAIKENGGGGFVISDAEIESTRLKAGEAAQGFSNNSMLAYAGYHKAFAFYKDKNQELPFKMPVILASGL